MTKPGAQSGYLVLDSVSRSGGETPAPHSASIRSSTATTRPCANANIASSACRFEPGIGDVLPTRDDLERAAEPDFQRIAHSQLPREVGEDVALPEGVVKRPAANGDIVAGAARC